MSDITSVEILPPILESKGLTISNEAREMLPGIRERLSEHIAEWEKARVTIPDWYLDPRNPNTPSALGMRNANLARYKEKYRRKIEYTKRELESPTWSTGTRSEDPRDYVYHGTYINKLSSIAETNLQPRPVHRGSTPTVWFGMTPRAAYGSEDFDNGVVLRIPIGFIGEDPIDDIESEYGHVATTFEIPSSLIDYSRDGGKTWQPTPSLQIK